MARSGENLKQEWCMCEVDEHCGDGFKCIQTDPLLCRVCVNRNLKEEGESCGSVFGGRSCGQCVDGLWCGGGTTVDMCGVCIKDKGQLNKCT